MDTCCCQFVIALDRVKLDASAVFFPKFFFFFSVHVLLFFSKNQKPPKKVHLSGTRKKKESAQRARQIFSRNTREKKYRVLTLCAQMHSGFPVESLKRAVAFAARKSMRFDMREEAHGRSRMKHTRDNLTPPMTCAFLYARIIYIIRNLAEEKERRAHRGIGFRLVSFLR